MEEGKKMKESEEKKIEEKGIKEIKEKEEDMLG